jgi:sporulation integral membrane protein YtvI
LFLIGGGMCVSESTLKKVCMLAGGLLGAWLGLRYAIPVLLPFLLGMTVALAAEPLVGVLHRKFRIRRGISSGIGVSLVLVLLLGVLATMAAVTVRQMGRLAVPELLEGIHQGLDSLEQWSLSLATRMPAPMQRTVNGAINGLFSGSGSFLEKIAASLLAGIRGLLGTLTSGFFGFATMVLAAFMISIRLPKIRGFIKERLPQGWRNRDPSAFQAVRKAVVGWCSAQLKLTAVTFGVLLLGFWLMKVPNWGLWAGVIALVDMLPVLGCGTVLLPWSLISLLQGDRIRSLALVAIYGTVWLARSVLEPKLLGKELGLDPLVTLFSIYAGYQLLGVLGMLLAPVLAVVATRLIFLKK